MHGETILAVERAPKRPWRRPAAMLAVTVVLLLATVPASRGEAGDKPPAACPPPGDERLQRATLTEFQTEAAQIREKIEVSKKKRAIYEEALEFQRGIAREGMEDARLAMLFGLAKGVPAAARLAAPALAPALKAAEAGGKIVGGIATDDVKDKDLAKAAAMATDKLTGKPFGKIVTSTAEQVRAAHAAGSELERGDALRTSAEAAKAASATGQKHDSILKLAGPPTPRATEYFRIAGQLSEVGEILASAADARDSFEEQIAILKRGLAQMSALDHKVAEETQRIAAYEAELEALESRQMAWLEHAAACLFEQNGGVISIEETGVRVHVGAPGSDTYSVRSPSGASPSAGSLKPSWMETLDANAARVQEAMRQEGRTPSNGAYYYGTYGNPGYSTTGRSSGDSGRPPPVDECDRLPPGATACR